MRASLTASVRASLIGGFLAGFVIVTCGIEAGWPTGFTYPLDARRRKLILLLNKYEQRHDLLSEDVPVQAYRRARYLFALLVREPNSPSPMVITAWALIGLAYVSLAATCTWLLLTDTLPK